ncbi:helix-turn-helix domain-containing protein [Streptomyces sp. DSM 44915]|uniref:Helix-turn-helix domain-containing protein n=1 Tax=Streptomyces chisholmiae TaxID=3075540 RepID=A0ABU2JTR9_9ACTN|nr:helix-turn-helix domain-containing protein [Streptomyces sp. DSM 44915]MDT0268312.1 helix-turn-helix domain-containing protein [Streptomyces sp. DSM 44915]
MNTPTATALPAQYLTPEDLVRLLQLPSVQTVYRWRKTHTGPRAVRIGKHLRYHPADVHQWLTEQSDPQPVTEPHSQNCPGCPTVPAPRLTSQNR